MTSSATIIYIFPIQCQELDKFVIQNLLASLSDLSVFDPIKVSQEFSDIKSKAFPEQERQRRNNKWTGDQKLWDM